jgi:hypothetical protein
MCCAACVPHLLTASVRRGNVEDAIAYTVACAIQCVGYVLCWLLS